MASFKSDPKLTPEEQELVDESGEIVQRSLFQGALLGCGVGLMLADNKAQGCLAGAGVGAVGGAVAGVTVGQGNVNAKRAIDEENKKIAELNAEHERLITFERKLTARIADDLERRTE